MRLRYVTGLVAGIAVVVVAWSLRPAALPADFPLHAVTAEEAERGAYLFRLAGCQGCHAAPDQDDKAPVGGRALESPFGTFFAPNITPDQATGIGGWSLAEFARALLLGVAPSGSRYFPAFPYVSYNALTPGDVRALYAYLMSRDAQRVANRPHETRWFVKRAAMPVWQALNFTPGAWQPDPAQTPQWQRGAYLSRAVGHCGECHTPRNRLGSMDASRYLEGNPNGPDGERVPAISASPEHGLGDWSRGDVADFLDLGMLPDGDFAGSLMAEILDDSLAALTAADRQALAVYLSSSSR